VFLGDLVMVTFLFFGKVIKFLQLSIFGISQLNYAHKFDA
jgi:hypothetical protein